jgi:predicted secreted protein
MNFIDKKSGVRISISMAAASLLMLTGCAGSGSGSATVVTVTKANKGETIALRPGGQLVVRLEANATTGGSWGIVESNEAVLKKVGSNYETRSDCAGRMGCGGYETWTFEPAAKGTTKLRMEYRQWFDKNGKVWDTFEATVNVSG